MIGALIDMEWAQIRVDRGINRVDIKVKKKADLWGYFCTILGLV